VDDMRGILVFEYCAGRISGCKPGDAGMPACPPDAGPAFFGQVPEACDVAVASFGLRFVLAFLASYPLDNVNLVGEVTTEPQPTAATRTPGTVDERLFSTEPGSNCTPAR
jgi:hypothetical protein